MKYSHYSEVYQLHSHLDIIVRSYHYSQAWPQQYDSQLQARQSTAVIYDWQLRHIPLSLRYCHVLDRIYIEENGLK